MIVDRDLTREGAPGAVIGMGSEDALVRAHAAALAQGLPLVAILPGDALGWASLAVKGSPARTAVRQAVLRFGPDPESANALLGTDDVRPLADPTDAELEAAAAEAAQIWTRPAMVFHAPFEIPAHGNSASRVRPRKMREAFRTTHRVIDLSGSPKDRAQAFGELRRQVKGGARVAFAYSENSTQPNVFASPIAEGMSPGLEARIFLFLRRAGIPFGQFYRDIYWRFPEKTGGRGRLKGAIYTAAYLADLAVLRLARAHVFLPSLPMARYVPQLRQVSELPPASDPVDSAQPEPLRLLYVGGLGPHYRLHLLVEAMARHRQASLTICVPEANWQAVAVQYEPLPGNVSVRHESGEGLEALYDDANAGVIVVQPDEYWEFAVPMKFYEYQAHGKAVVATRGTYAGELVERAGIGEAISYTAEAIDELVRSWSAGMTVLQFADVASRARSAHTWASRAATVARTLTGKD